MENEIKIRYPQHVRVVYTEDDGDNADQSQLGDDDSEVEDESDEVGVYRKNSNSERL